MYTASVLVLWIQWINTLSCNSRAILM
jgi:hypothetical protein